MKELTDVQIQRRANLQLLIDKYGSAVELARKLGFATQSRVSHLLGTKGMGETAARDIEKRLGLTVGWMDRDPNQLANMPNVEWLVDINAVLYNNKAVSRMSRKKLQTIIYLSYVAAAKTGHVESVEVHRLIDLAK